MTSMNRRSACRCQRDCWSYTASPRRGRCRAARRVLGSLAHTSCSTPPDPLIDGRTVPTWSPIATTVVQDCGAGTCRDVSYPGYADFWVDIHPNWISGIYGYPGYSTRFRLLRNYTIFRSAFVTTSPVSLTTSISLQVPTPLVLFSTSSSTSASSTLVQLKY